MRTSLITVLLLSVCCFANAKEIKNWQKNIPPASKGWKQYQLANSPNFIVAYSKDDGKEEKGYQQVILRILFKDTEAKRFYKTYDQTSFLEYGYNINCKRNSYFTIYALELDKNNKQVNSNFILSPSPNDWKPVSKNRFVADMNNSVCK
ncbi:hypothetical protein [Geomonas edaphica]|uniref:hypothetical protein n=1 Tax=Geomonas edaphica TaxID=2570226 RepID=UPI0010A8295D|nr:hypothetical protein [Geomonas edaphica]